MSLQADSLLPHNPAQGRPYIDTLLRAGTIVAAAAAWYYGDSPLSYLTVSLMGIALFVLTVLMFFAAVRQPELFQKNLLGISHLTDLLAVLVLTFVGGAGGGEWWAIALLFAARTWLLPYESPRVQALFLIALVPTVWVAAVLRSENMTPELLGRLGLVAAGALVGIGLLRHFDRMSRESKRLVRRLERRDLDLLTRKGVLEQTTSRLATQVQDLQVLHDGLKAMNTSLDLRQLLKIIVDNVVENFAGTYCLIALPTRSRPMIAATSGNWEFPSDPNVRSALERLAAEVLESHREKLIAPGQVASLEMGMIVPMVAEGQTVGAMFAIGWERAPYSMEERARLTLYADQAALAVKNSSLYNRVQLLYQQVKERSEELKAVLDSIGDAVIVTSKTGEVRLTNPVADVILGLPETGKGGRHLPPEVLKAGFGDHLRRTLESVGGDPVQGKLSILENNLRGKRSYDALSAPLVDAENNPRAVVTVLRDVTAVMEIEQAKNNFVSTISHELKTPLHSIQGFLKIILSENPKPPGPLNEQQRDFLSIALSQTEQLDRMMRDLLEYTRLESGIIRLNPEPVDLTLLAENTVERLRPVARDAQVRLLVMLEEALPVEGDTLRLEQVLNNLISNAIKFTPKQGQVFIEGRLLDDVAEVVVRDTGIGIPPSEHTKIFDRFYQVDGGANREFGGTGLGLTICKHIVERHGGRIWVESTPGKGSAFHFTIPRELITSSLTVDFARLNA